MGGDSNIPKIPLASDTVHTVFRIGMSRHSWERMTQIKTREPSGFRALHLVQHLHRIFDNVEGVHDDQHSPIGKRMRASAENMDS